MPGSSANFKLTTQKHSTKQTSRNNFKMVEVFKTNVEELKASKQIIQVLLAQFPSHKINFDLSDCDRILRVEGKNISPDRIIELIHSTGFCCEVLV
jgi:hypothetical protein